jgi:2-polyprenyl-3-methyl-5-hydroxy-6-metoxy-1,4-benzoquinol methylase
MKRCSICDSLMNLDFSSLLMRKYQVNYYKCDCCGLLQTEKPYWLDEAYSRPIANEDTGIVLRNISNSIKIAVIIFFLFDRKLRYVDVAGGYGLFTRLMRDIGFNFFWDDKYCKNIFSEGFEFTDSKIDVEGVTSFEVIEHIYDPVQFIKETFQQFNSRTFIFSTEVYRGETPSLNWDYYAFNSGQHISFYKIDTLKEVANKLGLYFYSSHGIHIITNKKINKFLYFLITSKLRFLLIIIVVKFANSLTKIDSANSSRKI